MNALQNKSVYTTIFCIYCNMGVYIVRSKEHMYAALCITTSQRVSVGAFYIGLKKQP